MMEWSFYIDHIHYKFRKDQDTKWWGTWWVLLIMNATIRIKPSKKWWSGNFYCNANHTRKNNDINDI